MARTVNIPEHSFGLMEPSSPIDTLATCRLVSCFAFCVHCPTTGRSALAHVSGEILNTSYDNMLVWCLDGRNDKARHSRSRSR